MSADPWIPAADTMRPRSRHREPGGANSVRESGPIALRRIPTSTGARRETESWLYPDELPKVVGLFERFRQRKMVQWLVAYLAMAAIILQLTEALAEMWNIPVPLQRGISLGLGFGVLPALVVAWFHGELGRQRVTVCELGIVALLVIGAALTIRSLCWP